jgi:penicillin-binding protein 1A
VLKRWSLYLASVVAGLVVVGALIGAFVVALLYPTLPSLAALTDYQPRIPLRVMSADGELLGEFGEERRALVRIQDVPDVMKHAILAAEDERFYQHGGVDYLSVLRAALANLSNGTQQGAGTITMQVARNFFLTREKTVTRKMREVMLAWKIEANLHKDEILELYINQIFLGQRAYGFAAAAQIYFGKALKDVTPAEAAMLAGLPKAPSAYNPVSNPERAKSRQLYVLRRMHELSYLTDEQYKHAQTAPLVVKQNLNARTIDAHAEFVAEMARQVVYDAYGDDAYSRGITVWTTIRRDNQDAAWAAMRKGVFDYDRRHGYRGPEAFVSLPDAQDALETELERTFAEYPDQDNLLAAVVTEVSKSDLHATLASGDTIEVSGDGLKFAARALADKASAAQRIRRGAVIRVARDDKGRYTVTQLPQAESAFVALRPSDGALLALVGGFDFDHNKFNHATQALRQPGSSFKPFIYSAALEKGFTPATVINDAPFFVPAEQGGEAWEPKNYENKFEGPMRLRTALAKSKNLVMVRVLQAIGPRYAQDYIKRFGFDPKMHPAYLTMGLGAGSATPLQMATAYAVFANGGYRVTPYLIAKITDAKGDVLSEAKPDLAGSGAERTIDPRNAFLMTSMMKDVIAYGTATAAQVLKRRDLAGKTGTTNDNIDAWFCGFNAEEVGVAWIGFDQPRTLGNNETGGVAALPIWIAYMQRALKGVPETPLAAPDGVVSLRINGESGLRDDSSNVSEYFYNEFIPRSRDDGLTAPTPTRSSQEVRDQIF